MTSWLSVPRVHSSGQPGRLDDSIVEFFKKLPYKPDSFQREAAEALSAGESVLVAAPTGAGKTIVAEVAIRLALDIGNKVFYTAPIKALSNQKFGDLRSEYGEARVGLLTGDNSINAGAEIVVMTTEVLRNMLYEESPRLSELGHVILDEVHYLQDPYRGATWEEVIIHLPRSVSLVCLSATASNIDELGDWIRGLRGKTAVITEEVRPVPLENLFAFEDRSRDQLSVASIFVGKDGGRRVNPAITRSISGRGGRPRRSIATPGRLDIVDDLDAEGSLPAIYFIFSRAGCDQAVLRCLRAGISLTSREETKEIGEIVERRLRHLDPGDLTALGYDEWLAGLEAGFGAHHAGLVPAFKEAVEELFNKSLVKVVFATETLSLGINMPARTVVIENLSKFNGKVHALLTPTEFTQLSGRAGRRGIDEVGYCMTLYSRWVPFERVAEIVESRSFSLKSSFGPTYNMATNLIQRHDEAGAHAVLESSFAQFHTERRIQFFETELRSREEALASLANKSRDNSNPKHVKWSNQVRRLEKETRKLARRIDHLEGGLVRKFNAIRSLLVDLGYVRGWALTDRGKKLSAIYCERDILITEMLTRCETSELRSSELAAVASAFTYESRESADEPWIPTSGTAEVISRVREISSELNQLEERAGLDPTPGPDPGFAEYVYRWAEGEGLETILEDGDSGGDFVRNAKQVVDICRQIASASGDDRFGDAADLVDRGVVAFSSIAL